MSSSSASPFNSQRLSLHLSARRQSVFDRRSSGRDAPAFEDEREGDDDNVGMGEPKSLLDEDIHRSDNDETSAESNAEEEDASDVEEENREADYTKSEERNGLRPNRFLGKSATWQGFTLEERQIAHAFDIIRSRDLAAHAYNSFALRERTVDAGGWGTDKSSLGRRKRWSAWPMLSSDVPRVDERLLREEDDGEWAFRKPLDDVRPSTELEVALIAVMLNRAKRKFEARSWRSTFNHLSSSALNQPGGDFSVSGGAEEASEFPLRPVFQADDDISSYQLRPLARRVITQFDQVLLGLHRARLNDARVLSDNAFKGTSGRRRRFLDLKRRERVARKSRANRNGDDEEEDDDDDEIDEKDRQDALKYQFLYADSLSPRDWSQVLGIASLVGLPSEAVMQAAKRCSEIFQSDMEFRELKEGRLQEITKKKGRPPFWEYSDDISDVEDEEPPMPPMLKERMPGETGDIVCPFASCPRHTKEFVSVQGLKVHLRHFHPEYYQKYRELRERV